MKQLLSIVIPVYNNEPSLETLAANLIAMHRSIAAETDLEIVMVNDGSRDRSWEKILELRAKHPGLLTGVRLSRNFGQLAAILAGYEHARGDAIVTISADLQDPTSLIPEMYRRYREGVDVVIAHRSDRKDAWSASFASRIAYAVARAANETDCRRADSITSSCRGVRSRRSSRSAAVTAFSRATCCGWAMPPPSFPTCARNASTESPPGVSRAS
jgi:glycosyltransferase involved in cell wall biosynthesis